MNRPEVAIVGAGPAGTAAGILLAQHGFRVRLYEQAEFPRAKTCGGCLSGDAVAYVRTLLGEEATELGVAVRQIEFSIGRRTISVPVQRACRIVPRDTLDTALAHAAVRAGVDVYFKTWARISISEGERIALSVNGAVQTPAWVLWAGGLGSLSGCLRNADSKRMSRMVGQSWRVRPSRTCPRPGEIGMHWLRGGYVGCATLNEKDCLIAIAVDSDLVRGQRPWEALCQANPSSRVLQDESLSPSPVTTGTAGFPYRPDRTGFGNLLLIGDAVGFEEPFSGEGIGQAVRSAAAAVDAMTSSTSYDQAQARYARDLRRHRRIRRRTRVLGWLLRRPFTHALADANLWIPSGWLRRIVEHIHIGRMPESRRW